VDEFGELTEDEVHLLRSFRNGDRLDRARIALSTFRQAKKPNQEEAQLLEYFAAYMDCSEYGRARCLEAAEIFATTDSVEEAHARLAEIEASRHRCEVVDISTLRPTESS
jgi:predicted negative regulator of RcsB-dependent stress response